MYKGLKRKALFAASIMALLCALWPAASGAGSREDMQNLARVLSYQKKYDESLARYDDYLAKYPGDMQAQLEAGDVSFWSGDYDRALSHYEKVLSDRKLGPKAESKAAEMLLIKGDFKRSQELYSKVLERNPSDIDTRIKVAELLSYEKRYDESIAQYDSVLKEDPNNLRAMRGRADALSWDQRFKESVTAYDQLLEKKYDADAARQKARVLGWAKRYGESLRAYGEAFEKSGIEAIRLERDGKKAFWNGWPLHAIGSYRDALTEEPDNAEARFDLGQTEGYERMWPEASSDFSKILEKMPGHFRARDSLSRVNTFWKKRDLTPEFHWFRAKSGSRDTDIDRYTAGLSFRQPIKSSFGIDAGYYFDLFRFGNAGSIPRDQGKIGLDFSLGPRVWGQAFYLPTGYPSDNRFSHLWKGSVSVRAMDQLVFTAFSDRDDMYNQRIVFDKGLHQTDVGGLIESRLHRRVTAYADYRYRMVNDSNKQNYAGVEGLFYIFYEPKRLTLDLRFDWQDWRYTTTDYWSPQNFWHMSGTIHWRHYLNPNGMYYGALNTYYGFKYRFQIDRSGKPFNGGAFEFHRDWSRRLETSVEAFGDYSSVYWDLGAMASMVLRF